MEKKIYMMSFLFFSMAVAITEGTKVNWFSSHFKHDSLLSCHLTPFPATLPEALKSDLIVTVTAYSPSPKECDEDPFITAFQKPVREGTIAISRDLEKELGWSLGDRVHLQGLGEFIVWDRMNQRWKKKVDIFFHDTEKAILFGVKHARVLKVIKQVAHTGSLTKDT